MEPSLCHIYRQREGHHPHYRTPMLQRWLRTRYNNQKNTQFLQTWFTQEHPVFQAKLYAIQMACDYAIHENALQVMMLSNCQAAIKAVYNPQIKSITVLKTVDSLNTLAASGKEVLLYWVRGHNNTYGNDLADHLAKTGAATPAIGPEPFLPLSLAICQQVHKAEFLWHWTDTWSRSIDYRQTKYFFPNPDISMSKSMLCQQKKVLGTVIRYITGHCYLNYHQSLQQPGISPICCLCGTDREESQHIICSCPSLISLWLTYLWQRTITDEWCLQGLIDFLTSPEVEILEDLHHYGGTATPPQTPLPSPARATTPV
jgi:hypothetical protein